MNFLKNVLASALGFFLASAVVFVLSVLALGALLTFSLSSGAPAVRDHSVLYLSFDRSIPVRSPGALMTGLDRLGLRESGMGLNDLLTVIYDAADNPSIDGIYMHPAMVVPATLESLAEVRKALQEFRESGKFIVSYGEYYSQKGYYMATAAGELYLNPAGMLQLTGIRSSTMFYKDALDKLGVEAQVIRHGTFKSAVEPFLDNRMSEANRLQTERYVGALWSHMRQEICSARRLSEDRLTTGMEALQLSLPGEVLAAGLVDSLFYKDQVVARLVSLTGAEKEDDLRYVTPEDYLASVSPAAAPMPSLGRRVAQREPDCIAIVYAEGDIVTDIPYAADAVITPSVMREAFRAAREDSTVKAVVFRINSGGGSALASDMIWREVALTAAVKPVVASFGALAASGGYYMAAPSTRIMASPYTLTGSIGVFGVIPSFEGLMRNKLGIRVESVNAVAHADRETVMRALTPEEKEAMQREVEFTYETFVAHVAEGRRLSKETVEQIAEGRVWCAADAVEHALVDTIGTFEDAIDLAVRLSGADEDYELLELPEAPDWMSELRQYLNMEMRSARLKKALPDELSRVASPLARWLSLRGACAMLPYEITLY
ncbi:MAG: signal peptide peptidase SppA [Bacteroidales bacterium]|nr:signal peptide peptidase SppA [Bacteroidales bacterium]